MRVLLDANVWRHVSDAGAGNRLANLATEKGLRIVVAPSVVYEALRCKDAQLRRRLVGLLVSQEWERLMPEAYSESVELRGEMGRLRPSWKRPAAYQRRFERLREDWSCREGGFWSRAGDQSGTEAAKIRFHGDADLSLARRESEFRRRNMRSCQFPESAPIGSITVPLLPPIVGWDGTPVAPWRLAGMASTRRAFGQRTHPYVEWLSPFFCLEKAVDDKLQWNRFWLHDISEEKMRRFWIRWAFEWLMSFRKVTDGTPCDIQLATHLIEADLFASADKAFITTAERCRREVPFPMARTCLVPGDDGAVDTLFERLSDAESATSS